MALDRESLLDALGNIFTKMLGLQRQLWECVRLEKEALTSGDHKKLQENNLQKEMLIESVRQLENERQKWVGELSFILKKPATELSLSQLIIQVQGFDLKRADQWRSVYQALQVLVKRIGDQNAYNRTLVEQTLGHINEMKRNLLGEAAPKSGTYNARGKKQNAAGIESRLITQEA